MVTRTPEKRLVYLHCSSIFKGANAQVRRQKKIVLLLSQHQESIQILTNEFSLDAIAIVAKQLLDDEIFESISRARLHFPELFHASETQEAEREASEAEAVRLEAEVMQETVLTSDEEGDEDIPKAKHGRDQLLLIDVQPNPDQQAKQNLTKHDDLKASKQEKTAVPLPHLHPIYLPFRTQHRVLTSVQSILEECCLEFGNSWVPHLMKAQKWEEAESIELNQWVIKVSKYIKSLPPIATRKTAGKSLTEVLFATTNLRHSAVHRLPTSAAGILNMINAAIAFTEALKDKTRTSQIAKIRKQLSVSIEDIVQHQTLLEHKLSDQLQDLARRRAEIDELERLALEDMLNSDKMYRVTAGSAVEDCLKSLQQVAHTCTCEQTGVAQIAEDESDKTNAASSLVIAPESVPCLDLAHASREGQLHSHRADLENNDISVMEQTAVETAVSATKSPLMIPTAPRIEGASMVTAENPSVDTISREVVTVTVVDSIAEGLLSPAPTVTQDYATRAETPMAPDNPWPRPSSKEGLPLAPPLPEMGEESLPILRSVSLPLSNPAPVQEPTDEPPATTKYNVALKIICGTDVLAAVVTLDSSTKTAISDKALAVYSERIAKHERIDPGWEVECIPTLLSVQMDGFEMDLSIYDAEDLTFLIQTISNTSVPTFTVQISQTQHFKLPTRS